MAAGAVAAAVVIFGIVAALRGGDERGEPRAIVTIERPSALPAPAAAPTAPLTTAPGPTSPAASASNPALPAAPHDADVEMQNGVRIIRMRPEPARPATQVTTGPPGAPPSAAH